MKFKAHLDTKIAFAILVVIAFILIVNNDPDSFGKAMFFGDILAYVVIYLVFMKIIRFIIKKAKKKK